MKKICLSATFLLIFNVAFACESGDARMCLVGNDGQRISVSQSRWINAFPGIASCFGFVSDLEIPILSGRGIVKIDNLLLRAEKTSHYVDIYHDLLLNFDAENFFEILTKLGADKETPLYHLAAQAFAHRAYRKLVKDPDKVDELFKLFDYFEERYPAFASYLKMYVYLGLKHAERIYLNGYISGRLSAEEFMRSLPEKVVQFGEFDLFNCDFPYSDRRRAFDGAFSCYYSPFIKYYRCDRRTPFPNKLLHTAIWLGEPESLKIALDSGASIDQSTMVKDPFGNPIDEGFPPLWKAIILGKLPIVQLLIERGANPLYIIKRNIYERKREIGAEERTILEAALSLNGAGGTLDAICCVLLNKVIERNPHFLKNLLEKNGEVRVQVNSLIPEISSLLEQRLQIIDSASLAKLMQAVVDFSRKKCPCSIL
ncbi:TPA: hypothetical protein DIC20_05290 [Candidatus Dependentiae bacterium]|nr:MAG: hypothetical protein US03_C0010G0026 [candidate division TM6 bacterium GW2011_GWF2_36_131]KKQ02787.1 MAG: hypothetical protein US13_C0010G0049 [candidate division TM6 bacterium GW2011_GWE2_36_25]KKQ18138.1 MAG: hypothetical protein US32_C0030G0005 [candidate division TM6 bacterium GW2011_GWA2_36_9]HBR70138.1 hypothetical protein [Candidatus Dependentiae bacterium]HCU01080.1 hypothetical protein [Candidatus Dependentiae bacterium]